jgi:hypothetical protein
MAMINLLTCPEFDKELSRLCKKYPSLESEFEILKKSLTSIPFPAHTFRINNL